MTRIIEYIGEDVEIDSYEEKHFLENQKVTQGIPINPCLREHFDSTPHDDRESREINDWWDTPYIVTSYVSDRLESYSDYHSRVSSFEGMKVESESVFDDRMKEIKEYFLSKYPSGTSYTVRCLTGGAWDRSSWQGDFDSLEKAIEFAS